MSLVFSVVVVADTAKDPGVLIQYRRSSSGSSWVSHQLPYLWRARSRSIRLPQTAGSSAAYPSRQ